ncbi:hypothetical protein Glove_334g79 [Diversispora epigaea]|uniref:Uncharacterized protein n=1 Tax=Diversispora epigaea TaxID=1348612 RepID=A0A397HIF3_9GLOM|nr:hypothetical protein Glove_334g79 [Diversispora epigaea]
MTAEKRFSTAHASSIIIHETNGMNDGWQEKKRKKRRKQNGLKIGEYTMERMKWKNELQIGETNRMNNGRQEKKKKKKKKTE